MTSYHPRVSLGEGGNSQVHSRLFVCATIFTNILMKQL